MNRSREVAICVTGLIVLGAFLTIYGLVSSGADIAAALGVATAILAPSLAGLYNLLHITSVAAKVDRVKRAVAPEIGDIPPQVASGQGTIQTLNPPGSRGTTPAGPSSSPVR